jgi:hypothetical protein
MLNGPASHARVRQVPATWFIAVGAVIVLGAVVGATWQGRADRGSGARAGNDRVPAER